MTVDVTALRKIAASCIYSGASMMYVDTRELLAMLDRLEKAEAVCESVGPYVEAQDFVFEKGHTKLSAEYAKWKAVRS